MHREIHEMRGDIIRTLRHYLTQPGKTAAELCGKLTEEPDERLPVWHTHASLYEKVAVHMRLDNTILSEHRLSNDFKHVIQREIQRIRRHGHITDLQKGKVFRCTLPRQPNPLPPSTKHRVQDRIDTSDAKLKEVFLHIVGSSSRDNTYKFALGRAILEHSRESDKLEIPYSYFAEKFLEYYWQQICRFHIKQDYHIERKARITAIIDEVFGDGAPASFKMCRKEDVDRAKKKILKDIFGHEDKKTSIVVHKFQNIKEGKNAVQQRYFYEPDDDGQLIRLNKESHSFFKNNYNLLLNSLLLEWTKFLEKINGSLPKLISKVERYNMERRGDLSYYRKAYLKHTCDCFYCNGRLERSMIHVDHVIPWSYMFEDEAWNLVLACNGCNAKKSNSLPEKGFLEELITRNDSYQNRIEFLYASLRQLAAKKPWKDEIRNHYANCADYGFQTVRLP